MRIYTRVGDLAFQTFTFPDGQPHFKLETYERDFTCATVETAIKTPVDLFTLALVTDVLRQHGYSEVNLDIRYLMGARMDRAIDMFQPYTLQVVARQINSLGFGKVRILDAHSEVATRLIRNSSNVLPVHVAEQVIARYPHAAVVIPDKGARERVLKLMKGPNGYVRDVIFCGKERDPQTGTLSRFVVPMEVNSQCLIIDDICDGGGTFVGLAKGLRAGGAKKVFLFVTHGIFSKGLPLEGIDHVYTTDSISRECSPIHSFHNATVIPISMEKL